MNIPGAEHYREIAGKLLIAVTAGIVLAAMSAPMAYSQSDGGIVLRGTRIGESFGGYATRQEQDTARTSSEYRSPAVAQEFQREHPCPSTGSPMGACPGYIKDHIIPLACGGPDAVSNIQWQTVEEAKAKDRWELKACGR
jgi:hypothetical protein